MYESHANSGQLTNGYPQGRDARDLWSEAQGIRGLQGSNAEDTLYLFRTVVPGWCDMVTTARCQIDAK